MVKTKKEKGKEYIQLASFHLQASTAGAPSAGLWLGETSSAWGGGAQGLSDTWVRGERERELTLKTP